VYQWTAISPSLRHPYLVVLSTQSRRHTFRGGRLVFDEV
jgi:hypothetical protein